MKKLLLLLALCSSFAVVFAQQTDSSGKPSLSDLSWAFPSPDKTLPKGGDDDKPLQHVPGSSATYAEERVSPFNPPDWFPDEHPPEPEVVRHGRQDPVQACSYCHVTNGYGHPQSANLTGLTVKYLLEQIADFKAGNRIAPPMDSIAKGLTDEDAKAASEWFASLKPGGWVKVVEADTVPKTFVLFTRLRLPFPDGTREPLGNRIIEVPEAPALVRSYDPHSGFIAYVPVGSIAKGEKLVREGKPGSDGTACVSCHGDTLTGTAIAPRIAGRSAIYIVRQLYNIQAGVRRGPDVELMKPVVANLTEQDMINIAAYVSAQHP